MDSKLIVPLVIAGAAGGYLYMRENTNQDKLAFAAQQATGQVPDKGSVSVINGQIHFTVKGVPVVVDQATATAAITTGAGTLYKGLSWLWEKITGGDDPPPEGEDEPNIAGALGSPLHPQRNLRALPEYRAETRRMPVLRPSRPAFNPYEAAQSGGFAGITTVGGL